MKKFSCLVSVFVAAAAVSVAAAPRTASVTETNLVFKTYPFSDPDPVPATEKTRYPYFFFDGTSAEGAPREWRAVILENEHIAVTILPEIGGKIWGAVDKRTGRDFIYYNHVVKFRNISQRGPWCSGGIEFNFGIIGHGPWTATPVSYFTRKNDDGSVSCFISETELVTESTWQVEVNLPADAEGFLTRTTWFNGSGFSMPYYQWMNAAYSVRGNPSFEFPGGTYIGHDGIASAWPRDDEGHDLSRFSENAFGGAKSEHVLDGDNGIYGIWWPASGGRDGFGSVHLNHVTQKYGRKVWLWSQSREGAIWEDLLTDEDGQYTELQSGRVFNQPGNESYLTPFKHPTFAPGATDTFEEEWRVVRDRKLFDAAWNPTNYVTRPQKMPEDFDWESVYGLTLAGEQQLRQKLDRKAEELLCKAVAKDPHYAPALSLLASLAVRRAEYAKAHGYAARALAVNTYDPEANHADGVAYLEEGNLRAAKERLGLAAYSPLYRNAAFVNVARAEFRERNLPAARAMLKLALSANALDFDALHLSVVEARLSGDDGRAARLARECLARLPLHHAVRYELNRIDPASAPFYSFIRNELPHETLIAMGDAYQAIGRLEEAADLFGRASEMSLVAAVRAAHVRFLSGDSAGASEGLAAASTRSVAFAMPFRRGSLPALAWAARSSSNWKFRYLHAVLLKAFARDEEAEALLESCAAEPDEEVFYLYRAAYRNGVAALDDLRRAASIGGSWRTGLALYDHFASRADWVGALEEIAPYVRRCPANKLNISYATALVRNRRAQEALDFLEKTQFMPSEHGDNASAAWIDACRLLAEDALKKGDRDTAAAYAKKGLSFPERLGAGRPYALDFSQKKEKRRNPLADWPLELRELAGEK